MKLNFEKEFWDKSNILARVCFILGGLFFDWGMRLSGYETNNETKNQE